MSWNVIDLDLDIDMVNSPPVEIELAVKAKESTIPARIPRPRYFGPRKMQSEKPGAASASNSN